MSRRVALLLVLAFLTALGVANIQPIKAASGKFTVKNVDQLMYALYWADNGDVIFIMNGTYDTPQGNTLTITKSISLVGEGANGTIIRLHPAWVQKGWNSVIPAYGFNYAIEIQGVNVNISGLTILSDGGSIYATGTRLQIRDCKIATYLSTNGRYQNISQNTITAGIGCYGSSNIIAQNHIVGSSIYWDSRYSGVNNTISGNHVEGVNIECYSSSNTVTGNRVEGGDIECYGSFNTVSGNHVVGGGILVGGWSGSSNMVYDNVVTGGDGINLLDHDQPSVKGNLIFNNTVRNCTFGLVVWFGSKSSDNAVYHNTFIGNKQQVRLQYNGVLDNGKEGNYWSDYGGKDVNGDGLGDTPYSYDRFPLMYPWGAPDVSVLSVENTTYSGNVTLNFTVNKPTSWIGYSLDGLDNVTVTENTTLTGLSSGLHSVTVYAKDEFNNTGTSETISFTITEEPEPFPVVPVAVASGVSITGAAVCVFYYRRKRNH